MVVRHQLHDVGHADILDSGAVEVVVQHLVDKWGCQYEESMPLCIRNLDVVCKVSHKRGKLHLGVLVARVLEG